MNFTLVTRMVLFFILIIVISLANYALLEKIYEDTRDQHNLINHTHNVIEKKNKVLSLLIDMETGQRGFIATKDKNYLEPYNNALAQYNIEFDSLKKLTSDNANQQQKLNDIKFLISKKTDELNKTIHLTLNNNYKKSIEIIKSNLGKNVMDSIRYQFDLFEQEEQKLLKQREDKFNNSLFYMRLVFLSITILLILVSIFFGILIHKHLVIPIVKLNEIINQTKKSGKLPQKRINYNSIKVTEIKNLTKSFFSMAQKIDKFTKELHKSKDAAIEKSITDSLTSLYNREYMDKKLTELIHQSNKNNEDLSLMIVDIDFFKKVNDTYGHLVGDIILREVANILKAKTRSTDLLIRYGGEEFIIILPNTNKENAINLANKLNNEVEKVIFDDLNCSNITISIGVSSCKLNDTQESFIKRADDALYQAKNEGRNKVVFND
jgi:diguanylate cyclase (GGDEF)-like protein